MPPRTAEKRPNARYQTLCISLARVDTKLTGGRGIRRASKEDATAAAKLKKARTELSLSGLSMDAQTLMGAGRGAFALAFAGAGSFALALILMTGAQYALVQLAAVVAAPLVARELVISYPATLAAKRGERIMRGAPESANLMIMSLRHEPSLSRAITFASDRGSEFSDELKRCTWDVVMGKHASFEDSLHALGTRWEVHYPDLKASLHAMVTSSCEATEDGKRRALDRANSTIISGARRRIEEYTLSLSTPSMVIFGLGIILPLMIGSFLPMMSWSIWTPENLGAANNVPVDGSLAETVFLMNILFPAVALVIAIGATSRHPLETARIRGRTRALIRDMFLVVALAMAGATCVYLVLDGTLRMLATLLFLTVPWAVALILFGKRLRASAAPATDMVVQDALFKTGARMVEGENFEAALRGASMDIDGEASSILRRLSFESGVAGLGFDRACSDISARLDSTNAFEGLQIIHEAASKNERTAGVLAMDLAAYLKDLSDLESTLRTRLRPTISMMKVTAYALGPVVIGVTFAIYLMLMAMAPGSASGLDAQVFFIVLGGFLAETNGVVSYFVWGIEGRHDLGRLLENIGGCVVVSELVYVATAMIAA